MSFSDDIQKFADKTNAKMDDIVRKVGVDLAAAIEQRSPVKTGRFRGNWILGVGKIDTTTNMEITDPSGANALKAITEGLSQVRAGGVFYISNSLPYAIPLEYGHSKQAPGGMVRLAVAEYTSYIEKAAKTL